MLPLWNGGDCEREAALGDPHAWDGGGSWGGVQMSNIEITFQFRDFYHGITKSNQDSRHMVGHGLLNRHRPEIWPLNERVWNKRWN